MAGEATNVTVLQATVERLVKEQAEAEAELARLRALLDLGLSDCFRLFEQAEQSFTWWDYRAAGFRRNLGLRIDHVLASRELAANCRTCVIDTAPRKLERPSDHTPLIAEFELPAA